MAKAKGDGGMNKRQMVQAAFEAKGDVAPGELQAYISTTYSTELPINIISSYKSQIKSKLGLGRKNKKRGRKAAVPGAPKAVAASKTVNLDDLKAVSQLIQQMGAAKVIDMVNLLQSVSK